MSVVVSADRLRHEMARRGLSQADLAALARVAPATITHAVHGRPLAAATVAMIARGLVRAEVVDGVDSLLAGAS